MKNKSRLTAAVLYLMAVFFFGAVVYILTSVGGETALSVLLAHDNPARAAVIFIFSAASFSLFASLLLFAPIKLSKPQKICLFSVALVQAVVGAIVASVSVVVTVAPLWFLFRYYRDNNA